MSLPTTDAQEFRRMLAGLADTAGGQDINPETFRDLAADTVLLLAICYNRKSLDSLALWTRIESAIRRALEETSGGNDLERFLHVALEHVHAPSSIMLSTSAGDLMERLLALDDDQRVHLMVYLASHLYPSIVHGRKLWNERKELQREIAAAQAAADKEGEDPT